MKCAPIAPMLQRGLTDISSVPAKGVAFTLRLAARKICIHSNNQISRPMPSPARVYQNSAENLTKAPDTHCQQFVAILCPEMSVQWVIMTMPV